MAWDSIAGSEDFEEYSGDLPCDVFAGALDGVLQRLDAAPSLAEHAAMMNAALAARGYDSSTTSLQRTELHEWAQAESVPSALPTLPKRGDLVAVRYAGGDEYYALVLEVSAAKIAIATLDRDASGTDSFSGELRGDDLIDVLTTPELLRRTRLDVEVATKQHWRAVARVPLADLPAPGPAIDGEGAVWREVVRALRGRVRMPPGGVSYLRRDDRG